MERITRNRAIWLMVFFLVLVAALAGHLYNLQIIETDGKVDNTTTFITETRVKASRGLLLDRNGNVMVGNRASYDLLMNHYVVISADNTNANLYKLVTTCKEKGIQYNESFPVSEQRPFTYTLDEKDSNQQSQFQAFLNYAGEIDSDITAPLLIQRLRDRYGFPAEWTDEEARLVIGMRYELSLRYCVNYLSQFVFLSDASDEEISTITELSITGLTVEPTTVREYNTKYAAHILGYVGAMSSEQWEYYKNIDGYAMDAQVGQAGLEQVYEEYLHGVDGIRVDEVTADGTLVSSYYSVEPKAGSNVEISIDMNLQEAAEVQLGVVIENLRNQEKEDADGKDVEGGAVVAMDIKTGQVLVCGSYPSYDLKNFFKDYNELVKEENNPLFNRALLGTYPPGSTYKMSTLVAALESGKVTPTEEIYDEGVFTKYDGFSPSCLAYTNTGRGHGDVAATYALRVSCNYYFYELGDRLSLSFMDETAKKLGLGEPTGIELPESEGYRANQETKKKLYEASKALWYQGDQVVSAIGQGDNRFTPLQLCVYTSTLANQGTRYRATFMNRVVSADYQSLLAENKPEIVDRMEISDLTYNTYVAGMVEVTTENFGTALQVFRNYPIKVAGKTGTAQEVWGRSDNGAFVCFAPADDPQIAIAVYVEKGGHGSTVATVAKSIMDIYFDVDEVSDVTTYENRIS